MVAWGGRRINSKRLYSVQFLLILLTTSTLTLMGQWYVGSVLKELHQKQAVHGAQLAARTFSQLNDMPSGADLRALAVDLAELVGGRVTFIRRDGVVETDTDVSSPDVVNMENHAHRPEVLQAWEEGVGISSRTSETIGKSLTYVAVPYRIGHHEGTFRIALYNADLDAAIMQQRRLFIVMGVLGFSLISLLGLYLMKRHVQQINEKEAHLVQARNQAEAADMVKTNFLANMSHELRTPLNAIQGFSEVMKSESFGPLGSNTYRDYAKHIHTSGSHLLSLIEDILEMSRIDGGSYTMHVEQFDVSELTKECIRLIQEKRSVSGIEVINQIADDVPVLTADRNGIKKCLANILSNAVKFTPEGGTVTVSSEISDQWYKLVVSDTGIGMTAEELQELTKPFTQIEREKSGRIHEGIGIGLTIARYIIEMHQGNLEIESLSGVGTKVVMRLPRNGLPESGS